MKILLFFFFSFCLNPFYSLGQSAKGQHEVFAGVGRLSARDIFNATTYDAHSVAPAYKHFRLIYAAGYKYYFIDQCAIGISIAQHSYEESHYNKYYNYQESNYYDAFSVCAELKGAYLNLRLFQLYGTFSAGFFYTQGISNPRNSISLYVSPIGIRIGNKVGFFVEGGVGYKGLIQGGLSYKFGKEKIAHKYGR